MLPDRVSNPGPLTYESGVLPIALRGPARLLSQTRSRLHYAARRRSEDSLQTHRCRTKSHSRTKSIDIYYKLFKSYPFVVFFLGIFYV